ncbi:MAG TPA: hypothetical protein VMW16_04610 [Sedimentisphaerales bacterium]|nr:hypothetical protein [Sedimentisphaerales bacterium]
MKRHLRKTLAGVSVTYSTGNFSNNPAGTNFAVEVNHGIIKVSIDLSCNLRVRNKEWNCFFDANELAEDHTLLKSLQIDDQQIIDRLNKISQMNSDAVWELEISLGDKGLFKYAVSVSRSNGGVFFQHRRKSITVFCT